jgi:GntR family transcriptional repressor for pyruvate dehydrogenase complex
MLFEVQKVQRAGLVVQVIEELVAQVTAGVWGPGDRLPSLTDLCVELDVGRSTLREAVQALAHRGVLEARQGSGTFVRAEDTGLPLGVRLRRAAVLDVYEARRGLEVEAARLAATRRSAEDLGALVAAAEGRRHARTAGVVTEWALADVALHRAVFAATHNPVLAHLFDSFADAQRQAFEDATADPVSRVDTAPEHDALVDAIAAGDPVAAVTATRSYLDTCETDLRNLLAGQPQR